MVGLLQHGVWRGGADLFSVWMNLLELTIEALVVSELNFKSLKPVCNNLKMMFQFEAELVVVDLYLKLFHFAGWLRLSRATTTGACEPILKHFKIV